MKPGHRTHLAPLAALVGLAGAAAGCMLTVDAGQYTVREEKRFAVTGVPDVSLITFDGSIEVRAWDRPEVFIEIEKRGPDKARVDAIEVKAEQAANRIAVEATWPSGQSTELHFGPSPSVRLVASVPRETNLVARSGDGAVSLERVSGQLEVETGDGSIRGTDLNGQMRAHTGDGSIRLEGTDGRFDLDTGDGGVVLAGRLAAVRIRTADGIVSVRAGDGSVMTDAWEIRTGDGGVTIQLPATFDADLNASCTDGSVSVDRLRFAAAAEVSRRLVRGKIGAGGHLLDVRTADGSIHVRNQ
jgi:hypothetical protein